MPYDHDHDGLCSIWRVERSITIKNTLDLIAFLQRINSLHSTKFTNKPKNTSKE